jgi:ABC-2 type transport system permease protein
VKVLTALLWVNRKRASKDYRIVIVALLLPVFIMFLVGTVFGGPQRSPVGLVLGSSNQFSQRVEHLLITDPQVIVRFYPNKAMLEDNLLRGRVVAGLVMPVDVMSKIADNQSPNIDLVAPVGQADSYIARAQIIATIEAVSTEFSAAKLVSVNNKKLYGYSLSKAQSITNFALNKFESQKNSVPNPYDYTTPSNLVLFVFLMLLGASSAIVEMKQLNIFTRMLATPAKPILIVGSMLLGLFSLALGQSIMLVIVGKMLFKVSFGSTIGLSLLLIVLSITAASTGVLLGTMAKTPDQGIAIGTVLGISMGMLGGCMWPLDVVGPVMRDIGHLVPQAWAMDAFVKLIYDHASVGNILIQLLVLLGFAVLLTLIASFRLRKAIVAK